MKTSLPSGYVLSVCLCHSTVDGRHSAVGGRHSAVGGYHSTIGRRHSAVGGRHSAVGGRQRMSAVDNMLRSLFVIHGPLCTCDLM